MPITLPSYVAPNELIASAWGNSVVDALDELDNEKADLAVANTFTQNQLVDQAIIRVGRDSGGTQFAALDTAAGNVAYLGFFGSATDINTPGTRTGLVGLVADTDVRLWAETSGNVELRSESGAIVLQTGAGVERARVNSAGVLVNKTSSSSSTTGVECLATGRINGTLDTVETNLVFNRTGSAISSGAVYVNALLNGSTLWSVARVGATTDTAIASDGSMHLSSGTGAVVFEPGATDRGRVNSAGLLINKSTSDTATQGCELLLGGSVYSTATTDVTNLIANKGGSAVVSAAVYEDFRLSNTTIGSITRNAATSAVLYNTTSDARLKTDVGLEVDDGLGVIRRLNVRRYVRDGAETSGVGMFAQELVDVIPQAVTPGGDDVKAKPWQVAYSDENIIGHLALAVQQLEARLNERDCA